MKDWLGLFAAFISIFKLLKENARGISLIFYGWFLYLISDSLDSSESSLLRKSLALLPLANELEGYLILPS
jgi:hypothetical protein